jgi:hypothetical protein
MPDLRCAGRRDTTRFSVSILRGWKETAENAASKAIRAGSRYRPITANEVRQELTIGELAAIKALSDEFGCHIETEVHVPTGDGWLRLHGAVVRGEDLIAIDIRESRQGHRLFPDRVLARLVRQAVVPTVSGMRRLPCYSLGRSGGLRRCCPHATGSDGRFNIRGDTYPSIPAQCPESEVWPVTVGTSFSGRITTRSIVASTECDDYRAVAGSAYQPVNGSGILPDLGLVHLRHEPIPHRSFAIGQAMCTRNYSSNVVI